VSSATSLAGSEPVATPEEFESTTGNVPPRNPGAQSGLRSAQVGEFGVVTPAGVWVAAGATARPRETRKA
jgi:hypothetical protein